ncbi:MAG: phosphatase PAP2 family protein [Chitinivibrionales bacterium]|nr:phosphatase PAP2 family protein [Chitinivibrionales bacterium]
MISLMNSIDEWLFLFFNSTCSNRIFDAFFPAITDKYFWVIPAIIAAIVFIRAEKKKALLVIGLILVTVAITDPVCCRVLKPLFSRRRPCDPRALVEGGRFLLGHKRSPSFPSAHAMNIFAQAMLLTLMYPGRWIWFLLFASAIGFSRIYTGVHYPLDVLGGALFGILIGFFVFSAFSFIGRTVRLVHSSGRKQENPGKTNTSHAQDSHS